MTGPNSDALAISIDLGGTLLRIALVECSGEVVWRKRVPSEGRESKDRLLGRLDALLEEAVNEASPRPIQGVGLGLAGPVDPETGVLYAPPYVPVLDGFSLKSHWESRHPWPVYAGNDATLAATGRIYVRAGRRGQDALVYLTISTGIGAGIVTDGQLLTGAYGMAGELGHIIVDPHGPPCACGSQGCLGALASGTGHCGERCPPSPARAAVGADGNDSGRPEPHHLGDSVPGGLAERHGRHGSSPGGRFGPRVCGLRHDSPLVQP